jgi:hypothetical protein
VASFGCARIATHDLVGCHACVAGGVLDESPRLLRTRHERIMPSLRRFFLAGSHFGARHSSQLLDSHREAATAGRACAW